MNLPIDGGQQLICQPGGSITFVLPGSQFTQTFVFEKEKTYTVPIAPSKPQESESNVGGRVAENLLFQAPSSNDDITVVRSQANQLAHLDGLPTTPTEQKLLEQADRFARAEGAFGSRIRTMKILGDKDLEQGEPPPSIVDRTDYGTITAVYLARLRTRPGAERGIAPLVLADVDVDRTHLHRIADSAGNVSSDGQERLRQLQKEIKSGALTSEQIAERLRREERNLYVMKKAASDAQMDANFFDRISNSISDSSSNEDKQLVRELVENLKKEVVVLKQHTTTYSDAFDRVRPKVPSK